MLSLENIFPLKYGIKTFYAAVYPNHPAPPKVVNALKKLHQPSTNERWRNQNTGLPARGAQERYKPVGESEPI